MTTTEKAAHPSHYNAHPSGVETRLLVEHLGFNIGTSVKYLFRAGLKSTEAAADDIEKAIVYLVFEEERLAGGWPPIGVHPRISKLIEYICVSDPGSLLTRVLRELLAGNDKEAFACFDPATVKKVRERLAARRPLLPEAALKILHGELGKDTEGPVSDKGDSVGRRAGAK